MSLCHATRVLPLALFLIPAVGAAKPHATKANTSAPALKKQKTVPMKKGANASASAPKKKQTATMKGGANASASAPKKPKTVTMKNEMNASENPIRKVQPMPKAMLDQVKRAKPLGKRAKVQLLGKNGLVVEPTDIGEPTTVSVRRPFFNQSTHLSFTGLNMVYPSPQRGIAIIGRSGGRDSYDDAPRSRPEAPDAQDDDQPFVIDPCQLGPICHRNLPTSRPEPTEPVRGASYATLRFKAAKDKAYIVDCLASGLSTLHGDVIVDQTIVDTDSGRAEGHFDLLVSRGERRNIRIDLWSEMSFNLRQCTITPVS